MILPAGYTGSVKQDIEKFLKIEINLVEDDIRLVSSDSNSKFFTFETPRAIHFFKDLSEVLSRTHQIGFEANHSINLNYVVISMKTKFFVKSKSYSHRV